MLFFIIDVVVKNGCVDVGEVVEVVKCSFDLGGEFVCGFENEDVGIVWFVRFEVVEDGEGESGSFIGVGLGGGD